ncbi:MAG: hypothetical protein JSW50_02035 [Candidatus Latescibacterota bacterium]|nr:MAG: hypothetical protein JSW50_02035 [Candidatus Latescibacterota bacterium]
MAVTYHELVIKGNGKLLRGFIRGYQLGKNIKRGLLFCQDYPINTHHLRHILTFRGDHLHIVCRARIRQGFLTAIENASDLEFEVLSDEEILVASFEFEFETFNKKVASNIKRILRRIPAGLELRSYNPEETTDPDAEGVEIYSPVHDYTFKGKGSVAGDIEKLCAFHTKLDEHEFFEVKDIRLNE